MRSSAKAFTLIELLVVCAIIAILAGIATSNYQEAQTRSKVSRVLADMRTMTTAIESYAVDHNKYPVRHHRWEWSGEEETTGVVTMMHHAPFSEKLFDPDYPEARVGLHVLTTPIAYLTSLPEDVFNKPIQVCVDNPVYWGYG